MIAVVLQVSVALAGLLLVFIGFVLARAESFSVVTKRDLYRNVGRGGFAPFALSLGCAWLCLNFLGGDLAAYDMAILTFRGTLILTGLYAFTVTFIYL